MIRRAEVQDYPWIVASGAEAYRDLGDYTRILPSWLEQPGVLAWIEHDASGHGRGFAMLGFYSEAVAGSAPAGVQHVVADLLALAVLPAYQRHGIGSRLLDHVIAPLALPTPEPRYTRAFEENLRFPQALPARECVASFPCTVGGPERGVERGGGLVQTGMVLR